MNALTFFILAALLFPCSLVKAQTPAPAAAEAKVAAITTQFQTAFDRDVAKPHADSVTALDAKYLGAVNRALGVATQAGNLEEALKLREEADRVTAKGALPPLDLESLPASLKQLRATYRGALEKLAADRDAKAQPYYDHYDKLLETLQTDLTKQGLIDEALAVKTKRDNIALDRPKVAAVAQVAEGLTKNMPASGNISATSPAGAATQKGSPWRVAAEWVVSLRGEVEIETDGKRRNVRTADQIPAGKFDIISISFSQYEEHDGLKMKEVDLALLNPLLRNLERVFLDKCSITGAGLEAIAGAPKLRTLSLVGTLITDDAMKHLANLPSLTNLQVGTYNMTGAGLAHLRSLPKLKRLVLDNGTAQGGGGKTFTEAGSQALAALVQLEELSAHRGNLFEPRVKFVDAVGKLVNLRRIDMGDGTVLSDADLAPLSSLTKLESVGFSNSQVSGVGIAHLKASAPTLKAVHLSFGCPVTDDSVQSIVTTLPNLERLSIGYGGSCGPATLRSLAALKKLRQLVWSNKTALNDADPALFALLPALEILSIFDTPITDTGMAGIALCKQISTLTLSNTPITDAALPHLKGLKSLRKFHCAKSNQVTDAGIAAFKKMRPDVTIER